MLLTDYELQARPHMVDCAHLDIDKSAAGQDDLPDDVFGHIRFDLACTLRPGHPDHAIRRDRIDQGRNAGGEIHLASHEDQHKIAVTGQPMADYHTVWQLIASRLDGALSTAMDMPALRPSFFGSGVPE